MSDNKEFMEEEIEVLEYTLTDEEGNESKFELIGKVLWKTESFPLTQL